MLLQLTWRSVLRVSIDAARELRVVSFVARDREVHVGSVFPALVILAGGEHGVLRTRVLANQSAQIAETMRSAPQPEGALAVVIAE
jgi:hypothetical protein